MEAIDYPRTQVHDDDDQDVLRPDFPTDYPQWVLDSNIEKGYDKLVEPFVEKLGKEEVKNIDGEFDKGYEQGCLATIGLLSNILNIGQRQIIYEERPGSLERVADTIVIPAKKEGEFAEKDRLDTFEKIAYEMWRTRQHDVAEAGSDDRSGMYRDGLRAPAIMDMDDAHQPMELEARAFAENARDKFFDVNLANTWRHCSDMRGAVARCSADIEELSNNPPTPEIKQLISAVNNKSDLYLKEQMRASNKLKELTNTKDFIRYRNRQSH